ncbi:hypothetical protein CDD83_5075 [Cordyceps sp. RAO-2017]|nr:hypothetical protein CDD83_5075 [Cordyceps sp. RAO-2017]
MAPGVGQERAHSVRPEEPFTFRMNPQAPQDMTLHMSLDVTDDLDGLLEEYSKLWRLGHFDSAQALFKDRLEHFLDNSYVLTQHGQCLLQAKAFTQLAELAARFSPNPLSDGDALQLSWNLILRRAEMESNLDFHLSRDARLF